MVVEEIKKQQTGIRSSHNGLDSGDNSAAEGYMKEADKSLSGGQAKMHVGDQ
jgi:hypothetical protein